MYTLFVLSLAILGASAAPCGTGCGVAVNNCLPGPTFVGQTPVVQNPTSVVPGYVPTTSVSQSCHCLKTAVRPQLRTEIISVPQVDRIVRIVPSPVVEAVSVNCGGSTRQANLPTCGINTGCVDGFSGVVSGGYPVVGGISSGVVGGISSGVVGGISSGVVGGISSGVVGGIASGVVGGVCDGVSGVVGSYPVFGQGFNGCGGVVSGGFPVISQAFPSSVVGCGCGC